MKISHLVQTTGVQKETIHYYIRAGLLPKPRKTGPNQADYTAEHVERIRLIKEMQDRYFLSLSAIKKILKANRQKPDALLEMKTEYFRPLEQFLPSEAVGEEAFLSVTGLSRERLRDFEAWQIIAPVERDGHKVYSQDDLYIGKAIGAMRRVGLSHEKGFSRTLLKEVYDHIMELVRYTNEVTFKTGLQIMSPESLERTSEVGLEIQAAFIYHLYRRMAGDDLRRRFGRLKEAGGVEEAGE